MAIGIYVIRNTSNGKRYIGQSIDIQRRFREHKSKLKLGKHGNKHLQAAWNKYGGSSFDFSILLLCPMSSLDEQEAAILASSSPEYNKSLECHAPMRGRRHTDATRAKMSIAKKKPRGPHSEERRKRISEAKKGKPRSDAAKNSTSETLRKAWKKRKAEGLPWKNKRRVDVFRGQVPLFSRQTPV